MAPSYQYEDIPFHVVERCDEHQRTIFMNEWRAALLQLWVWDSFEDYCINQQRLEDEKQIENGTRNN